MAMKPTVAAHRWGEDVLYEYDMATNTWTADSEHPGVQADLKIIESVITFVKPQGGLPNAWLVPQAVSDWFGGKVLIAPSDVVEYRDDVVY